MATLQRVCANHSDREAIGRCVITGKAICAECSTRYEGVNYSKEGLLILQEQRAHKRARGTQGVLVQTLIWLSAPVLTYLMYLAYSMTFESIIDLMQLSR